MEQPTREGLIRAIRRWDLLALAINSIIGAGIFGLPSEVFSRLGIYSLAAFVVCAAAMGLVILCFAEVSSRFSDTGGPYLYAREAFGPAVGFQVGWILWIARMTAFAANCNLFLAYGSFFVPWMGTGAGRAASISVIVVGLMLVNLVGVREAAVFSNILTVAKLAPLALFAAVGCVFINPGNYAHTPTPAPGAFPTSVLLLVYAFSGFEMVVIAGGEARDPGRDLPRTLLTAISVVSVFYILIQIVAIGTLPQLASSMRPLTDAAIRFLGNAGGALITGGALVSIMGNLHAIMLVGPRLPFAMAERGELPAFIASTHPRFHTPYVAIFATAALMLVLALSGSFVYTATISVIARLLTYAATCAALPVLRRRVGLSGVPFVAPAGVAVSIASLALIAWLLSGSTTIQARDAAATAAVGLVVYWAFRLKSAGRR